MSTKTNGGERPAFPITIPPEVLVQMALKTDPEKFKDLAESIYGITTRTYVSTELLNGLLVNGTMPDQAIHTVARFKAGKDTFFNYAAAAVELADILLDELAKRP